MRTTWKRLLAAWLPIMLIMFPSVASTAITDVGDMVVIEGSVYACDGSGSGLRIDTGDDIVTIYGIGPQWYWRDNEVDRPTVGEYVIVYAYEILFSDGSTKLVADGVDLDADGEIDIDLRDDDGRPLWRQTGGHQVQTRKRNENTVHGAGGQGPGQKPL